jgi:hypothetical protein
MLTAYVRRAFELPPHVVAEKAARLVGRLVMQRLRRRRDFLASTYASNCASRVVPRLAVKADDVPASLVEILPELCQHYLEHRFDLLGSGWVQVRYGLTAAGLEGNRFPPESGVYPDADGNWLGERVTGANLPEARHLWRLIAGPYEPIDWQIDFKSGFRWDGRRHFRDLKFGDRRGVDVKVPWELARLQHLPQLAIAHLLARAGQPGFREPALYESEVRNQIIDFLATNPPRFGVNWLCPMDVGIRAANMLLAVDLLRAGGATLDTAFEAAVANAATAHARHILGNLEWSTVPRSNHYLANIAGVMFCAIYLPVSEETDAWLDFAAQQLGEEVIQQFHSDGGNFEGSTNYHRLSAELALFSAAALLPVASEREGAFTSGARHRLRVRPSLGDGAAPSTIEAHGLFTPLPEDAIRRLEKAVDCVVGWSKPDGRPPQIGDTDSGRLFKLHPTPMTSSDGEPHEDLLDQRALLSTGAALFEKPPSDWLAPAVWFDGAIAASLAGGRKMRSQPPRSNSTLIGDTDALGRLVNEIRALPPRSRREVSFALPGLVPSQMQRNACPDFGLFVFLSSESLISLRCVAAYGGGHTMGHYHDDNLALELHHQGRDIIVDPGSYLYTPLAEARNRYRSATAHFVPRPEGRAAGEAIAPFAMRFSAAAHCVYFGAAGIAAVLEGENWKALRAVLIDDGRISVLDGCMPGPLHDIVPIAVSDGYGRRTERISFVPGRRGGATIESVERADV